MLLITVYDHPTDYPDWWVVRGGMVALGAFELFPEAFLFRKLEDAQTWIARNYPELILLQPPGADPDPKIYEVYG